MVGYVIASVLLVVALFICVRTIVRAVQGKGSKRSCHAGCEGCVGCEATGVDPEHCPRLTCDIALGDERDRTTDQIDRHPSKEEGEKR